MVPFLILIGFMGAGKTTVGRLLGSLLILPFVDADQKFEKEIGLSPGMYIRRFGEAAFRKQESRFLREILNEEPVVLATGGGAVLKSANRGLMLQSGFVTWLDCPLPMLLVRLQENLDRPLISKAPTYSETRTMLEAREPLYKKCHFKITNAYKEPKQVAMEIAQVYKKYRDAPGTLE